MVDLEQSTSKIIEPNCEITSKSFTLTKKLPKRGIIYLSSIPPYMNVTSIREFFSQFGNVGRIFLQLAVIDTKHKKISKKKIAKKFTEGWVEFERKSLAKKVAELLNNKQVDIRKKSKQFDCLWNIKYLHGFKWIHLNERLAYERAARRQKIRTEIQLAKKKSNFFQSNLNKRKNQKNVINREMEDLENKQQSSDNCESTNQLNTVEMLKNFL